MGFLRSVGLSLSSKSRPVSAPGAVPDVAHHMTACLEKASSKQLSCEMDHSPHVTRENEDQIESSSGIDSMRSRIAAKEAAYKQIGDGACQRLLEIVTNDDPDWEIWEAKDGLRIDKRQKCLSGSICGRGSQVWIPSQEKQYNFDHAADFLWDDKTKPLYDEFTQEMLVLIEYPEDYLIVNQVFHGRFGISGRDFIVVIHKMRCDTDTHERLIIGAASVPKEEEEIIDASIIDDEVRRKHFHAKQHLVRGVAYTAGFCLTRDRRSGEFCVTYVHDADVKTQGVPKWIVNRVKLDQLRIVRRIPVLLEENHVVS